MHPKDTSSTLTPVKVLGLGDCTLDYLFRGPEMQKGGCVGVKGYQISAGGIAATATVACARLGADTEFICQLGSDEAGDAILVDLAREGVNTDLVARFPGARSAVAFIHVDSASGERSIAFYSDPQIPGEYGIPGKWPMDGVSCVLVDDVWLPGAISAAEEANRRGIPVIADLIPADWNSELIRRTDVLIAPGSYGRKHAKDEDYTAALQEMHSLGPRIAVITLGPDGCWYSDGATTDHCPAFPVEVVDTTGAGDSFHGGFAYAMAQGWELPKCVEFASAVAAIKCQGMGRATLPSFEQVVEFLETRQA